MPITPQLLSSQSTVTLQQIVDIAQGFGDITPVFNVAGQSSQPALAIANDVMNAICAVPFPHKWNEMMIPQFYTNSYQQDYVVLNPNGTSITNLSWLERGIVVDINNTANPKPYREVECGRQLPQATGTFYNSATNSPFFLVNWFPNQSLYYGTWGQGNLGSGSFGNNPYPSAIYNSPVGAEVTTASWASTSGGQITFFLDYIPGGTTVGSNVQVSGAYPAGYNNSFVVASINTTLLSITVASTTNPGTYQAGGFLGAATTDLNQPFNPITQIQDANGNLLVLTQYGTEGTTAPLATVGASPGTVVSGTDATTEWTVADPNGYGFRILPIPSQTGVVWEFNLYGQMKPVRFTSLGQTLAPLPDEFEPHFRQGFIAQAYRYSPEKAIRARFKDEWQMWLASLVELRAKQDRELEENSFTTDRQIMGSTRSRTNFRGPQWPFAYPIY